MNVHLNLATRDLPGIERDETCCNARQSNVWARDPEGCS